MVLSLSWLVLSLIAYNVLVFVAAIPFDTELARVSMISGAVWTIQVRDALVTATLLLLFVEILKATRIGGNSLVDHALSTIVFIICLIEFLVIPEAATSLFFFITLVTLIDVIAGFSVTIRAAQPDFAIGPGVQ